MFSYQPFHEWMSQWTNASDSTSWSRSTISVDLVLNEFRRRVKSDGFTPTVSPELQQQRQVWSGSSQLGWSISTVSRTSAEHSLSTEHISCCQTQDEAEEIHSSLSEEDDQTKRVLCRVSRWRQCIISSLISFFITGTFMMVLLQKSAAISLSVLVRRGDEAGSGSMLTGGLSAGLGVMLGILVTGNNSGAHMNPAVTLGMTVWGRTPVTSLPAYMMGQFLGSLSAASLLLCVWWEVISEVQWSYYRRHNFISLSHPKI